MQVNDILFALSIITFILAAIASSVYLLHGGVWLAVASVVLYAGLPVWWTLPAVGATAVVHLAVRFSLLYREFGRLEVDQGHEQAGLESPSGAQVPKTVQSRAKMALQALVEPAAAVFRRQPGVRTVSVEQAE